MVDCQQARLPAGLSLDPAGTIAGTPTTAATASFTVQVKDSANATATKALSLVISPPSLTITTAALPNAAIGSPYSQVLSATGGAGSYRWSLSTGALPAGLSLDASGRIAGIPTGPTSSFTVRAVDSSGAAGTRSFTLTVAATLSFTTPATLPGGVVNVAYSAALDATGGTPPYTYAVISGQLPPGLHTGRVHRRDRRNSHARRSLHLHLPGHR